MNGLIKKLSTGLVACAIAIMGVAAVGSGDAYAADPPCVGNENSLECSACIGTKLADGSATDTNHARTLCQTASGYSVDAVWGWVYTIINWVLIAVGIICVVFIIIGGIRYATSGGDPDKVKSAKNTILYALIGLVIAILANVIVQIVFQVTGTIVQPS